MVVVVVVVLDMLLTSLFDFDFIDSVVRTLFLASRSLFIYTISITITIFIIHFKFYLFRIFSY